MAAVYSRLAFFQFWLTRRNTKYTILIAAYSVGQWSIPCCKQRCGAGC